MSLYQGLKDKDVSFIFSRMPDIRTTNGVKRLNRELARRTKIAGLFPNADSLLRLSSALLMEISEEWETGKAYIKL